MLREFSAPIPGPKQYDWAAVPAPQDCGEALGDPTALCGRIVYEGSYHRQDLSGAMETCLLRETLCRKLCQAVNKLPLDYSILIFDALRPLPVQQAIYDRFKAQLLRERPEASPAELELILDDFVAKPVKRLHRPAPHTTGGAVDLTLCKNGVPLDMGTGFDDFTALARTVALEQDCPPGLEKARNHRRLLFNLMASVGLVNSECEWWHYAYGERQWAARTGKAPIYGFCQECDFPA